MVTAAEVRAVAATLPRAYETVVRDRVTLRVKQLVFVKFSAAETGMGFAYPKDERDALIASAPHVFLLPRPSDLRYNWVHCHLDPLEAEEMEELVIGAWGMCVPKFLRLQQGLPG